MKASEDDLTNINDIGPILAKSIYSYFNDKNNLKVVNDLLKEININKKNNANNLKFDGMTFVITGSLNNYENRDELIKVIEENGGKVATSVSKNTTFLINNDLKSNSTKNKKAKELNIPIIDEKKFIEML